MLIGDISWMNTSCFASSYESSIKIYENQYQKCPHDYGDQFDRSFLVGHSPRR
jgi:hypothetical protein